MERLVVKSKAGSLYYNDTEQGVKLEPHEITPHQRRLLLERLHVYEDTGLTPPEIVELKERERREMAEHTPDQNAGDWFRRPAGVQVLIRAQAEQIHETPAEYIARKFNIRSGADGQEHTE